MQFVTAEPIITLLIVYIACRYGYRCWSRFMRHLNIRAHGWPPAHLDADGDLRDDGRDGY